MHALRDLALAGATLWLWRTDSAWRAAGESVPVSFAALTGLLTALCSYFFHEWGHLLGARLGGSFVRLPASPFEVFLFNFDSDRNTPRQFAIMSCGGFAASAVAVVFLPLALPWNTLATWVALGLAGAGVVATAVLELPPFFGVLRGAPIPTGAAYVSGATEH